MFIAWSIAKTFFCFFKNGDASIMIDHALQHNTRLHGASQGVDDLIGSGSSILSNLREQRVTLKGVQKRILDIASTLGLSNTLIRLIDKRGTQVQSIYTNISGCVLK